ncbi:transposase family protein [Streptomyces sp. NPDC002994]|uniref:transposase family protein n=1 Tax=Streptomyces sp. NPDC002994 TaxID=3154441 RepID=UPI0033B1C1B2
MVLIDGTLIPTQRRTGKATRRNYSGKHHYHGLYFLALTDERGRLVWISAARPGRTHDITAARHDHILARLRARRSRRPRRPRLPRPGQRRTRPRGRHRLHRHPRPQAHPRPEDCPSRSRRRTCTRRARLRPPQELADPHQAPYDPDRATQLLRALLVLTNLEINR